MNTNAVAVVALLVLAGSLVGASSQAQLTDTSAQRGTVDGEMGDDLSVFMQRSAVAANASVDAGMWLAAFETANNLSRQQTLVRQRAATLERRLDRLDTRIQRFPPPNATALVRRSQRARLVAERDALRNATSEATTTAAGEGVNATALDELGRRLENLTVPPVGPNDSTATAAGTANVALPGTATPAADRDEPRFAESHRPSATYSGP